ncbi:MAG TPA: hypothetical protein VFZ51_03180 [Woeseiaceae bacterium]
MNDCTEFREQILIADLDELRGTQESALTVHLRSCTPCSALASRILTGYATIDRGLTVAAHRGSAVTPLRRRRWPWAAVPLSAAAVLALLLLPPRDEPPPRVDVIASLLLPEAPVVTPGVGQQAVLFDKSDMTIVWLYNQETP